MIYPLIYLANFLLLYGAYLGSVFYPFGARMMLMDTLVLACLYGLAAFLHGKYPERGHLYSLCGYSVLGIIYFLLLGTIADRMLFVPVFFGVLVLIRRKLFAPHYFRVVSAFEIHYKVALPVFVFAGIICGFDAMRFAFLPLGILALILQIFLMRILRHDPSLWKEPSIVKVSCLPMLPGVIGSFLFAFWGQNQPVGEVTVGFYQGVIAPLLHPFIYFWTAIGVFLVEPVVRFVFSLMGTFKNREMPEELGSNMEKVAEEITRQTERFQVLAIILVFLLLLVLVFFLLRWIGHVGKKTLPARASIYETERRAIHLAQESESAAAKKVRELYKTYLKSLKKKKIRILPSDTTEDILNKGNRKIEEAEIRAIYLRTRYQNQTEDTDAAKMQELLTRLESGTRESKR